MGDKRRALPSISRHCGTPGFFGASDAIGFGLKTEPTCYVTPRSNGVIRGRSFMIAQSLASVSGSRLLCPAVVMQ
jgi:hypothetical protein